MPVKDRAHIINKSIKSILEQTHSNWELIIVDDHSSDNIAETIESYTTRDSRIKLFNLKEGGGPAAGRAFAARNATSELFMVCDSDDISLPHRVEQTLETFSAGADVVYGDLLVTNEITGESKELLAMPFDPEVLKRINIIPAPTSAFTKAAYNKAGGYDTSLMTSEDYDLWIRISINGGKFIHLPQPLVNMVVHQQSITKLTALADKKENLQRVRTKNHLATPDKEETLSLINDPYFKKMYDTEYGDKFWFS